MKKLSVLFLSLALVSILAGCFHAAEEEGAMEAEVGATVEATAETPAQ